MARATTATMNFDALRHNYRLAKRLSGNKAVAIIKANAYGHGAVLAAEALKYDADAFGVTCIEEAMELRSAGIKQAVLILDGFFSADELPLIADNNFCTTVHSLEQIQMLARSKLSRAITVWLKMDTGMHRLGITPEQYAMAYRQVKKLPQVSNVVLMTHFACADAADKNETYRQIELFERFTKGIAAPRSLANSAGTLDYKTAHRDWQRPGIMLYGVSPFAHKSAAAEQLQAVMSLTSEVITVRDLVKGDAIGYGGAYVCDKNKRIGIVALGYADGYPRHAKTGTPVLVNGKRSCILGRVSMDMLAIDLSEIDNATVGTQVELWGENLPASEVAPWCDTIPYTLLTGITSRVHKVCNNLHEEQGLIKKQA